MKIKALFKYAGRVSRISKANYISRNVSPQTGISGKQSQQRQVSSLVKDEFPQTNSRYRSLRFALSNCGLWFLESLSITEIKPKVLRIQAYSIIIFIIVILIYVSVIIFQRFCFFCSLEKFFSMRKPNLRLRQDVVCVRFENLRNVKMLLNS